MLETKREAICAAALSLFAKKGPVSTTTREIAQFAETAEGNIYRHFKGKDDLIQHLFEQSANQFYQVLLNAITDLTHPRDKIDALVKGVFEFADEHPDAFAYLLSVHHLGVLNFARDARPPIPARLFIETLKAGISSGHFRQINPLLATGWIVAMAQRTIVLLNAGLLDHQPKAQTIKETTDAVLRLLNK